MLSPYIIPSNSHKRKQRLSDTNLDDDSPCERDLKRPQMTSEDVKSLNSLNLSHLWILMLTTQRIRNEN